MQRRSRRVGLAIGGVVLLLGTWVSAASAQTPTSGIDTTMEKTAALVEPSVVRLAVD